MPNACCRAANDAGTLLVLEDDQSPEKPELVCYRCPDCRCRHFELTLDPVNIGLEGSGL